MRPLEHTLYETDSTTALSWFTKGSVTYNNTTATILGWRALYILRSGIFSSGTHVAGKLIKMADEPLYFLNSQIPNLGGTIYSELDRFMILIGL